MLLLRNSFGAQQKGIKIHQESAGPVRRGKGSVTRIGTESGSGKQIWVTLKTIGDVYIDLTSKIEI